MPYFELCTCQVSRGGGAKTGTAIEGSVVYVNSPITFFSLYIYLEFSIPIYNISPAFLSGIFFLTDVYDFKSSCDGGDVDKKIEESGQTVWGNLAGKCMSPLVGLNFSVVLSSSQGLTS